MSDLVNMGGKALAALFEAALYEADRSDEDRADDDGDIPRTPDGASHLAVDPWQGRGLDISRPTDVLAETLLRAVL